MPDIRATSNECTDPSMVDGRHRSASGAAFAAHRVPPPIRSARRAPRQRSSRSKASSASQRAPRQSNRTVSLTGELTLRHPQYVGATHRAVQNETDRSPIRIHDGDRDFAAAIGRARRNAREGATRPDSRRRARRPEAAANIPADVSAPLFDAASHSSDADRKTIVETKSQALEGF